MASRPVTSPQWKTYEIVGDVHPEALRITIGFMLYGSCSASIGGMTFVASGNVDSGAPFKEVPPLPRDSSKVEWLRRTLVPVRTIDPQDIGFADLQPLKKSLVNARVVMLGEQTHGDGATIYAKQRLIRFLHQEMGFDVLAWESGFGECEDANDALASSMPLMEAVRGRIYGTWSGGGLLEPLFSYIRSSARATRSGLQVSIFRALIWATPRASSISPIRLIRNSSRLPTAKLSK